MADKNKFVKPELKKYSAKKLLTQDRLMNAMIGIREIQTKLWETMPDDQYEKLEPEFDTAIAAMMAHMCGVMPAHAQPDQENSQDILMPATEERRTTWKRNSMKKCTETDQKLFATPADL